MVAIAAVNFYKIKRYTKQRPQTKVQQSGIKLNIKIIKFSQYIKL